LRTPLTAIQVALDLISCGKLGALSHQQQQMIDIATKNTERLIRLTKAIEREPEAQNSFLSAAEFAQLRLEQELSSGLTHNQFQLHYQPIVGFANSKIVGFEALLRWQHPTLGMVSPEKFIPLAETSDLIIDIGTWVLRKACEQLYTWQSNFPEQFASLSISVNLSSKHLKLPNLFTRVKQVLRETGLISQNLILEITESSVIENLPQAKETLANLKNLGVRISIDDFGTGYSSLSRLYELPLDILKIDRSFIQQMDSESGQHLVHAIATLAKNLGIDVIAEGIETAEQIVKLRSLGCSKGQGYFFSKPLDEQELAILMSSL
jgi:EAL domain-containing protein (putative c-di-GMP-specific phosphodiesterase class I)